MSTHNIIGTIGLTGYECCGMLDVTTKGAYREPKPCKNNNAYQLMAEVNAVIMGTVRVGNPGKQACNIDKKIVKKLLKYASVSFGETRKKSGLTAATFDKAIQGGNIYLMTATRIAQALGVETNEIIKGN